MKRRDLLRTVTMLGLGHSSLVRAQASSVRASRSAQTQWVSSKDGTRIAYEVIGGGPTLVLQHGGVLDRNSWRDLGYVDALVDRFQLILIDARGHGESDGPDEAAAYSFAKVAEDVAAVVEAECDEPTTLWGYSMGGRIAYACMAYTPGLYRRLVIGGDSMSVLGMTEEQIRTRIAQAEQLEGGLEAIDIEDREFFQRLNLPALAAYLRNGLVFDATLREKLDAFDGPVLIYMGEKDADVMRSREAATGARLLNYLVNPTFVELPDLDHSETHRRPDLVLPHVLRFLAQT
jgi:pimeloyl-ACP methyl ester carboxylesterase